MKKFEMLPMECLSFANIFTVFVFYFFFKFAEICALAAETGPGRAMIMRFHYNKSTGTCEEFVYGGAKGNANNFRTQEECLEKCKGQ